MSTINGDTLLFLASVADEYARGLEQPTSLTPEQLESWVLHNTVRAFTSALLVKIAFTGPTGLMLAQQLSMTMRLGMESDLEAAVHEDALARPPALH